MENNDIFIFVYLLLINHEISKTCLTLQLSERALRRILERQHVCDMNKKATFWLFEETKTLSRM